MVVDELDRRAADPPVEGTADIGRAVEVIAVGIVWSLPGMLLGLFAAALAPVRPDLIVWFGVSGTILGGVVGL